jgi:hypothetical protein
MVGSLGPADETDGNLTSFQTSMGRLVWDLRDHEIFRQATDCAKRRGGIAPIPKFSAIVSDRWSFNTPRLTMIHETKVHQVTGCRYGAVKQSMSSALSGSAQRPTMVADCSAWHMHKHKVCQMKWRREDKDVETCTCPQTTDQGGWTEAAKRGEGEGY